MNAQLCQWVDSLESQLISIRRHLHRYPELSGCEFETTRYLAGELEAWGIPCRRGPDDRGLIVDLGPSHAAHRLALRADLDAIAVPDLKEVEYRSSVENVMHACGHDAHATMLLGAVYSLRQWMESRQPDLAIRAVFQPEEETAQGASRLIEAGVLDGVNAIVGLHVDPTRPVGTVGLRSGRVTAHCDELLIDVTGRGGHAARPCETIDPIAAATQFMAQCYAIVPRAVNALHPVVLSFGSIVGGTRGNVIPDRVSIQGTLRTLVPESRSAAWESIHRIAEAVTGATGASIDIRSGLVVPSVIADQTMTDIVHQACAELLGEANVQEIPHPSLGGEDFAFYCQTLPAAFARVGCAASAQGGVPLHNSRFDIDESVLSIGSKLLTIATIHYFEAHHC